MSIAPWQTEVEREGMALLYPERGSAQYELREKVETQPELQALLFLRDVRENRDHPQVNTWLEQAKAIVLSLPAGTYPDTWLTLFRECPVLDEMRSSLEASAEPEHGLPRAELFLRAATLGNTLGLDVESLKTPLRDAAERENRAASSQFYGWGTLIAGFHELKWPSDWVWERVKLVRCGLPAGNRNMFCQLYAALAARCERPEMCRELMTGISQSGLRQSLQAYLGGAKAPPLVGTTLRNFRHAFRAERPVRTDESGLALKDED